MGTSKERELSMGINGILSLIGIGLITLGGLSGIVLFLRASAGKAEEGTSTGTLWGLFIVGLIAGIIILSQ
ncbi:conserved hypothetical protein [Candidatus Magnetomoraceae bacterium gMMP-1]